MYLLLHLHLHLAVTKIAELINNLIINVVKLNFFVFSIGNRWVQLSSGSEIDHIV